MNPENGKGHGEIDQSIDFAVFSMSLSFAVNPKYMDAPLPRGESGYNESSLFTGYDYSVSPRIQLPGDTPLTEVKQAGEEVSGFDLGEINLVKYSLMHRTSKPPIITIEKPGMYLIGILRELGLLFDSELPSHLELIRYGSFEIRDLTAYNYTSVLFVHDLDNLIAISGSGTTNRGATSDGHRFLVMSSRIPPKVSGVRRGRVNTQLMSVTYIIEYPEFVDWARGKRESAISVKDGTLDDIKIAEERLALIFETDLLIQTWVWLRKQSLDLLNKIPKGIGDGTLQEIMDLTEIVGVLRTTHIQSIDFLSFRNDNLLASPSHLPLSIGNPKMNFSRIKGFLDGVDAQLSMLERTIGTKLTLKALASEQQREEQERRREATFSAISIILGALVFFEVIATWFSWLFNQNDLLAHIVWIVTILALALVIGLAIKKLPP